MMIHHKTPTYATQITYRLICESGDFEWSQRKKTIDYVNLLRLLKLPPQLHHTRGKYLSEIGSTASPR